MEHIPVMEQFEELLSLSALSSFISAMPGLLIQLAFYIATAIGIYTIAKRRGISNPWLAFVPVVNVWTLGAVSDQYRSVVHRQTKSRRKVLLCIKIAMEMISVVVLALCGSMLIHFLAQIVHMNSMNDSQVAQLFMDMIGPMVRILVLSIPLFVLSVVHAVFYYIALYDIFKSCDPNNAVLYLVLSILIGICRPVFLLICMNKDDGMPAPRPGNPPASAEPWEQNRG